MKDFPREGYKFLVSRFFSSFLEFPGGRYIQGRIKRNKYSEKYPPPPFKQNLPLVTTTTMGEGGGGYPVKLEWGIDEGGKVTFRFEWGHIIE